MQNIIFDINIILDFSSKERDKAFPESKEAYELSKQSNYIRCYISTSSLDNIDFLKKQQIKMDYPELTKSQRSYITNEFIKSLLENFKLAKTPSYIDIDFDDIEDSQVIASVKAVDAQVVTRDKGMLDKYPDVAITPKQLIMMIEQLQGKPKIDFANLKKQYFDLQPELEKQMDEVLNATSFIMGDKIKELERELTTFTGAKHAITCSSGTDALLLAMMAMDIQPDDEIITTPFTFIATAETIALMKAKPVFVDIEEDTYNIDTNKIEAAITSKTKAIIPVSLYGQPADMDEIDRIAKKHNLKIIIDGAQSFGATYKGKTDSNLGDISTTSFFPAKPLGCYGDGGVVFTNNDEYAEKIKMMRVHGQNKRYHHKYIGMGGRLDTLQAAILLIKLKNYKEDLKLRQEVAEKYTKILKGKKIKLPTININSTSAWAQYSVRVENREVIQEELRNSGIPTAVHYPMPLHLQECFKYLGYKNGDYPVAEIVSSEILSLPMNPYLDDEEINYIEGIIQ